MLKTLTTLIRGQARRAGVAVANANALTILDEQIAQAASALLAARRRLALATVEAAQERARLAGLGARIADFESRARAALAAGQPDLAREAATAIAGWEREQAALQVALASFDATLATLRTDINTAQARFEALRRGRRLAGLSEVVGRIGRGGVFENALSAAEVGLEALRNRQSLAAGAAQEFHRLAEPEESLAGRLDAAGCGERGPTPESVLARLRLALPAPANS